jgi:dipeptidyl aminopeptidase/acylaminoacyl peptidase
MRSTPDDGPADARPTEIAALPTVHHPTLSPAGDRVAYFYDATGRNELYVQPVDGGDRRQVSGGEVPRDAGWHLDWPDDETVVFHRDEGGDEQNDLVAIDVETGDTETLVAPDGQALCFDVAPDEFLVYGSDAGEQMNLYRYDLETGKTRQLTRHDRPVWSAQVDPDGERVAYVCNEADDLDNRDTYVVDAGGGGPSCLEVGETGAECHPHDWFSGGDRLLLSDDSRGRSRVGVYDFREETVTWLSDGTHEESGVVVAPDERVVATRVREAAVVPVVYEEWAGDGPAEARELDVPEGVVEYGYLPDGDRITADGGLLLPHSTPTRRSTLAVYDLDADDRRTLVEPDHGPFDPDRFVDAEYVTYESDDVPPWCEDGEAREVGALLYDPLEGSAADDGAALPGVVWVHGGPHVQAQRSFSPYVQFLAASGYAVLRPNYRGSAGRGREFQHAIHGDWGGMEQADIAAGGRWLADREWVDGDRLAVIGGSFGGFSAYTQLVRYPELWAAGVAWVGITDLPALYEESMPHYRSNLERQMGDPDDNEALWRDRSPITHVDAVRAPVCIVHGVNDPRCPVSQARRFRDALLDRGWTPGEDGEFEYVELGEEGHGSTDQAQTRRRFERMGEFLQRRL